jgi:hypothetical protein
MDLKEELWLIGAIVYVLGMFPLYYLYNAQPFDRFGALISGLTLVSIVGAVGILFMYMLIGAWGKGPREEDL